MVARFSASLFSTKKWSLRTRLLVYVSTALTPILLLSGVQAYFDARSSMDQRRDELVLVADRAIDRVEQYLSTSETLLRVFEEEIATGQCKDVYDTLKSDLFALSNVMLFDADGNSVCSAIGDGSTEIADSEWLTLLRVARPSLRTEAFYGEMSDSWLFAIFDRVEAPTGDFVGAASFGIEISKLIQMFENDPFVPDDVSVALTDVDGRLFGTSTIKSIDPKWIATASTDPAGNLIVLDGTSDEPTTDLVIKRIGTEGVYAAISRPSPGLFDQLTLNPVSVFGLPLLTFSVALLAVWLAIDGLVLTWLTRLRRLTVRYATGQYDHHPDKDFETAPAEISRFSSTLSQMARRISQRDTSLREAIQTRDDAVREIHHRVKNNLQIVTSFLNLQSRQVREPAAKEVLAAARHRIDALSIVHQTLYQHERLDTVHMKPFLEGLLSHLRDAMGMPELDVELNWSICDLERASDDAIPIALFVLEAVTNAVKYAFAEEGGNIVVQLNETEDGADLIIEDDGVGIPNNDSGEPLPGGLGSKLMQAFAKQLHGAVVTNRSETGGVRVILSIPS